MKRICILLLFPVHVFAQVSMNVTPFEIISPGNDQIFLRLEFESHEPVQIEECTIDFQDSRIFDFVDRLALHQDGDPLPVLSHASEFLYNPWLHYPSVYVGIGEDTTVTLDYVLDTYQHYPNVLQTSITCRVNYYANPQVADTIIGPVQISSNVALSICGDYEIPNVLNKSVYVTDIQGRVITNFNKERPGVYVVVSQYGRRKYIVQ